MLTPTTAIDYITGLFGPLDILDVELQYTEDGGPIMVVHIDEGDYIGHAEVWTLPDGTLYGEY